VLEEQFPLDDDILLTLDGGDMNHIDPFRHPDYRLWGRLEQQTGWKPVLEPGTPTHTTVDKYPRVSRAFKIFGINTDGQQLDAIYARAQSGAELVSTGNSSNPELQSNQIGYSSRTREVEGSDHFAVEATFWLPARDGL
jgi:hypothetical protein